MLEEEYWMLSWLEGEGSDEVPLVWNTPSVATL